MTKQEMTVTISPEIRNSAKIIHLYPTLERPINQLNIKMFLENNSRIEIGLYNGKGILVDYFHFGNQPPGMHFFPVSIYNNPAKTIYCRFLSDVLDVVTCVLVSRP